MEANGGPAAVKPTEVKEDDPIRISTDHIDPIRISTDHIDPVRREVVQLTLKFYEQEVEGSYTWKGCKFEKIACLPATTISDIRNHINSIYCSKGNF